ncbi:MAG: phosphatase PAP2 family protein [Armatimonadetes bacterium]|nr:phosphatase PAP2 family protein [Armatimonadota bacterium]
MTSHLRRHSHLYWLAFYLFLAVYQFLTHRYLQEPHRQTVAYFFSGPIYISFLIISIGLLLCPKARGGVRERWTGWWAFDACVCTFIVSHSMKLTIPLYRPSGSSGGFPSGHTMFAFALAYLMLRYRPKLAPVWFGIACAVGWSRVEVDAHYPYQVLFGAAFGLILGWLSSAEHGGRGFLLPRLLRRNPAVV